VTAETSVQASPSYLPEPGDLLAQKYRVLRTIGRGGMGIVFAATHELLHQTVAIKLLVPELAAHPDAIGRFLNEARASARIRSEHVATVMDVGTLEGGAAYMVMEFLEGSDLEALLAADGVMSVEKVTQCMLQALEGIAHAHALGIIHRDLKPSNLFLSVRPDGALSIKVLDFGISKAPRKDDDGAATHTHEMLGSPLFMSPEQVRSAKTVDARSDLWSLGVIMYRLLTGTTPFVGDNFGEVLAAILVQPYVAVAEVRPGVPAGFSEVIDRCLERDRDRRYANAAELAMALEPFAGGHTDSVARVCRVLGVRREAPSATSGAGASQPGAAKAWVAPAGGSTVMAPVAAPEAPPPTAPASPRADAAQPVAATDPSLGPSAGPWSGTGPHKAPVARRSRRAVLAAGGIALAAVVSAAIALRPHSNAPPSASVSAPLEAPPVPAEIARTASPDPTPEAPSPSASIPTPAQILAPLPAETAEIPAAPQPAAISAPPAAPPRPASVPWRDRRAPAPSARPQPIDSILLQRH
jgi:serine/threonine-protein kinase